MARNRIIYGSQSVWCNGEVLFRVQTLGSTTTFTNEDIFELGHLDIVDVVDDVPAVAVTLNTNDWGDVKTMAVLAQVAPAKIDMDVDAIDSNANLTVISGTTEVEWFHGVSLTDFAITCGNLTGVSLWAPVQDECALGEYLTDDIEQTLYMDEVYVNSVEFSYTTGANATENYAAETDQKMWLLNAGKFVSFESWTDAQFNAATSGTVTLGLTGTESVVTLEDGTLGFLRTDDNGARAVTVFDVSATEATNWPVGVGSGRTNGQFTYDSTTNILYQPPTGTAVGELTLDAGDYVELVFAADAYSDLMQNYYFRALQDLKDASLAGADNRVDIGALRQGQIEIYIVDPGSAQAGDTGDATLENAWRLSACTITNDLTREPLTELGHLGPYDRPLTLPVPITVTVDSTAGDLELWARFAKLSTEFADNTLDNISLADLLAVENLKLVVKVFAQTDEEAGGTGSNRTVGANSFLVGEKYFDDGLEGTYSAGNTERALKTIVVDHLKMTDEAYTLDLGTNATQTYGFRSTNDLYVIKGDISFNWLKYPYRIRRNG